MLRGVAAVVPTFQPDASLLALVEELDAQVDTILVSDDASPTTSDPILRTLESMPSVKLVRHQCNRGIARGLNDGLAAARAANASWLLTVDQDSRVPEGYVERLVQDAVSRIAAGERIGAVGAESISESSGTLTYPLTSTQFGSITEEVIQTGTLWNVDALSELGGFDETLGMDAVDAAACLRLRQAGMLIAVAPGTSLDHRIGQARTMRLMGRDVMVTGHSPQRRTSMLRNRLRLLPAEFAESPKHALRTMRRVVVNQAAGLVIEKDRWNKARGSLRGLRPSDPE